MPIEFYSWLRTEESKNSATQFHRNILKHRAVFLDVKFKVFFCKSDYVIIYGKVEPTIKQFSVPLGVLFKLER